MRKIPLNDSLGNYTQTAIAVNELINCLSWIDPFINPDCGKIEPSASYRKDGKLFYADGTNWNPGGNGKGLYRYDASTETFVKVG